jgi:anti-sigma B factor antagonist
MVGMDRLNFTRSKTLTTKEYDKPLANEYFQMKWHGDVVVIMPSPEVEQLPENLIQPAAEMLLAPMKDDPPSHLIVIFW